ncbi:hypothetical protein MCBG_04840 [Micromonospora sp. M42]|nr:hypothetical protein MCBG_04840 [Micromonospora sp. M42]
MRHDDEIDTPRGRARFRFHPPADGATVLVLGHGAGGDVDAPDLTAVRDAVRDAGAGVALVTQPYRVAGRRAPAPAGHLDEAWTAVLAELRRRAPQVRDWVVGGRSLTTDLSVTVRSRRDGAYKSHVHAQRDVLVGAAGVVALAFPLQPAGRPGTLPGRGTAHRAAHARGQRRPGNPFRRARTRPGDRGGWSGPGQRHDLRGDPAGTAAVVRDWLRVHGWLS